MKFKIFSIDPSVNVLGGSEALNPVHRPLPHCTDYSSLNSSFSPQPLKQTMFDLDLGNAESLNGDPKGEQTVKEVNNAEGIPSNT